MPRLLWWGRSDPAYSRNQNILAMLDKLGWKIDLFHPYSSYFGRAQAFLQRPPAPDVIWVPCFRQRDMASAVYWARRWNCPLVFDPLISAYQKEVFEKKKWPGGSRPAEKLRQWESGLFQSADLVIADTRLHAGFFADTLGVERQRIAVIHVGADEQLFTPEPVTAPRQMPYEVLFYGSFLALHGPEVIVDAAAETNDHTIRWVLLGDGDAKSQLEQKAARMTNVSFEPWIGYDELPERIRRAHIVLGIFGNTPKASMVIPNKAFQALAMGRPLITRASEAYPTEVRERQIIGWVPPGDSHALAECVREWISRPEELAQRGRQSYDLYQRFFSADRILGELQHALDRVERIAANRGEMDSSI